MYVENFTDQRTQNKVGEDKGMSLNYSAANMMYGFFKFIDNRILHLLTTALGSVTVHNSFNYIS